MLISIFPMGGDGVVSLFLVGLSLAYRIRKIVICFSVVLLLV